jgi:hypothetical protein
VTAGREQWFHFGPWVFNIDQAQMLLADAPRQTCALDANAWATAYGLTSLDDPRRASVNLIGPTPDGLDRLYAMSTDLTEPVLLGRIRINASPPAALLIDGVHRLYRAWREGVPQLPAYVLTTAETLQIRHDKLLGSDGTSLTEPPT